MMHDRWESTTPDFVANNLDKVICGNSFELAKQLPDQSIQAIITSPPYYGHRDYQVPDQVGQEKSSVDYVDRLVLLFHELKRSLNDEGTLWLNMGDTYKAGQQLGLPWRTALALQSDGWVLRSDIIWHKPNAMPASITTRPTTDHEYLFLFSKSTSYYYDADSIREPHVTFTEKTKMKGGRRHLGVAYGTPETGKNSGNKNLHHGRWDLAFHPLGRNKRTVWSIPLGKFREAHFAVFPPELVMAPLKAGSRAGDIILDPFMGSGTVGVVAKQLKRHFIGFEISRKYVAMANRRISATPDPLF